MTSREAAIFTTFADTVVTPERSLPAIGQTDAARAFDDWLTRAPKVNALALRAALTALDVAPLALGFRKRLRKLGDHDRARYLARIEKSPSAPVRQATKA